MVAAASQASVEDVWDTFQSGKIPETAELTALKKTALPEKTLNVTNSVSLFGRDPKDASRMLFRQNIDNRAIAKSRKTINDIPNNDDWAIYLKAITESGSSKNISTLPPSWSDGNGELGPGFKPIRLILWVCYRVP
ncbi:unnamed protein product [Clonostachys solani]|uniref:Uncharacterized protein n=1 Tax=Clonostachys solani TaxID=160281 RepID=A0A9N9Z5Y3_9HYPO|nr:unnamed protein product [Clonostachys solani]